MHSFTYKDSHEELTIKADSMDHAVQYAESFLSQSHPAKEFASASVSGLKEKRHVKRPDFAVKSPAKEDIDRLRNQIENAQRELNALRAADISDSAIRYANVWIYPRQYVNRDSHSYEAVLTIQPGVDLGGDQIDRVLNLEDLIRQSMEQMVCGDSDFDRVYGFCAELRKMAQLGDEIEAKFRAMEESDREAAERVYRESEWTEEDD